VLSVNIDYINTVKNFIDGESLKKLYFAMVHLHLSYCINVRVYSAATQTNISKVEIKQKQAIRTISLSGYRDHTAPILKKLKILPLEKLIIFNRTKFMHNYLNNKLPLSFSETWIKNRDRNLNLNLRNAHDLYVERKKERKNSLFSSTS